MPWGNGNALTIGKGEIANKWLTPSPADGFWRSPINRIDHCDGGRLTALPMRSLRRLSSRHQWLAMLMLAVTLLARLSVPPGYMIGQAAGAPTIEICTGQGPATLHLPDGPANSGKHGQANDHPCVFAAAASAADVASPVATIVPATTRFEAPLLAFADARPGLGLAAPPPPKTGPPIRL